MSDLTADRERAAQLEADMKKAKAGHDKTLFCHEQTLEQTLAVHQRALKESRTTHEQAVQVSHATFGQLVPCPRWAHAPKSSLQA